MPDAKRIQVGTWMPPTYDPVLNLVYYGTSVTSPTPKFILGGNDKKHLYSTSTLAINPDTGKIVWYYQHILDHWDLDTPLRACCSIRWSRPIPRRSCGSTPRSGRAKGARC